MKMPIERLERVKSHFEEVKEYAQVAIAVVTIAVFIKKRVGDSPTSNPVLDVTE